MRCRFDPWVGKIPWKKKWQPTPVFLLENPMDRGACWATVRGVAWSRTRLSVSGPTGAGGGGRGLLCRSLTHSLVHLAGVYWAPAKHQSLLRCWIANVPEMGLLGSGRESRSKTRCSQMPEPVQAGEGEGPRSFLSSFPRERVTGHASVTSGQGQRLHGVPPKLCAHPNLWDLWIWPYLE